MMTDRQVNAFAAFITEGRPDWQPPGVVAALRADREHHDTWQLAVAMIRRAANPANTTPRLQPFDHDPKQVRCSRHPSAALRTDGTCGGCWADRAEAAGGSFPARPGRPIPPEARELILAAVNHRAEPIAEEGTA